MKKLLAVCLAAGILTITGCSADTVAGITEQSQFQRGEADSASQAEQTGTAAASASASVPLTSAHHLHGGNPSSYGHLFLCLCCFSEASVLVLPVPE